MLNFYINLIGIGMGIVASIPVSILLIKLLSGGEKQEGEEKNQPNDTIIIIADDQGAVR